MQGDFRITDDEKFVLGFLQRVDGQQCSLEEISYGVSLVLERVKNALSSLEKLGLIEIEISDEEVLRTDKSSLEGDLLVAQELLSRLSRLVSRKESTKPAVYNRVKERVNEELSRGIANLEFAVDKTLDRLTQIVTQIGKARDEIEEANVSADIGEISRDEADRRIGELWKENARLEVQRKDVLMVRKPKEFDALKQQRYEDESHRLKEELEELEVRKQVREFDGREEEYAVKRDQILAKLSELKEKESQDTLVATLVDKVCATGQTLVEAEVLSKELLARLARVRERLSEMSSSLDSEDRK